MGFITLKTGWVSAYVPDAQMRKLARNSRGQFDAGNQKFLDQEHRRMAEELQQMVGDRLSREKLRRPSASTGKLRRAVMDPANRTSSSNGFGVGSDKHMDASPAGKWWRSNEYGSYASVGRRIRGAWMSGGVGLPFRSDRNSDNFQSRNELGGAFFVTRMYRGTVLRPFPSKAMFRESWEDFDAPVRAKKLARDLFRRMKRN